MNGLRNISRKSQNGNEREASRLALGELNDFVYELPYNLTNVSYGVPNVKTAVSALRDATEAWHHAAKSDTIEQVVVRALDRAATGGSGANIENSVRQNLRAILDSKSRRRGFTNGELDTMRAIVRGDRPGTG